MTTPVWITPPGFVGTFTEGVSNSVTFAAKGAMDFNIITGTTPPGFVTYVINTSTNADYTSTLVVSGTPYHAGINSRYQFVLRANNDSGVTDRTFYADIVGASAPIWVTPSGFLKTGISSQYYSINGQFVDYQLSAEYDALPPGQKLRYYIEDFDGTLPPGLQLTEDGRIIGHLLDNLKLSYRASASGGYDTEAYDKFPYDHVTITSTSVGTTAKFISKTYQFRISVTDGISTSKQSFKIRVEDPASLRVDDTYILADTNQFLADAGYLLSPQWLSPANLGYIRANNNQIIQLSSYDFEPGIGPVSYGIDANDGWRSFIKYQINSAVLYQGKTYICTQAHMSDYSFDSTKWVLNELPPHFKIDSASGTLYASLPYQPAYSIPYSFTVFAKKTDVFTGNYTVSSRKFYLTIKGDVETVIRFVTGQYIGSIAPGYQSELSVVAEHTGASYSIKYSLSNGNLPKGLSLSSDGTIKGRIDYDSQTSINRYASYSTSTNGFYFIYTPIPSSGSAPNKTTIDNGTTTFDNNYNFSVVASDIYDQSAVEKEFYLTVNASDLTKYTKIYVEPFLKLDQRSSYKEFINNTYVFDPTLIYRLNDPAFGIQPKIQMYLEFGIEQTSLDNYSDALKKYFYRKRFYFGNVKYSKANDQAGNHVYDIVYVEVIDGLENTPTNGISGSRSISGHVIYPNSTLNMRNALQTMKLVGQDIRLDEFLMPRYMRTIQPNTGSPLGFILAVPLCYALPGNGPAIVNRIAAIDFDFSTINFEIDRIIVNDNLTDSGAKYLLFPRRDMMGDNLGANFSYVEGPEPVPLETEDGILLESEI